MKPSTTLSIIIPAFNEEKVIPVLYERLTATMQSITDDYEVIWVNDCSTDGTLDALRRICALDQRVRYLSLSRNFGHQKAITAGLEHCHGKAAVIMDGDLQDPPEFIAQLWSKYQEGYKVVYAQRAERKGEHFLKKATAAVFYRLLKKMVNLDIPVDTGDFRLIDRVIIDCLARMPEQHKFIRGQIAWIGYRQASVRYVREERHSGKSHYSISKLIHLAIDGITAFSNYPLHLTTIAGFIVSAFSFLVILYALYSKFVLHEAVTGWTSLIISSMFIGGIQLIAIGIIGQYISRISSDVRKRPLYVVEEDSGKETN
jgi:glycosyltransferase involved in cell wall biosynthesis